MREQGTALILLLILFSLLIALPNIDTVRAADGSWTLLAPLPAQYGNIKGAAVIDGRIYFFGDTNWRYDPMINNWTSIAPTPIYNAGPDVVAFQDKIYLIGGNAGDPTQVYDPDTDTWENKTSIPTSRYELEANIVDGKIYLIGGGIPGGARFSNHAVALNEVYDPATDSWSKMEPMPKAVKGYASAVLDDKIYIMGGYIGDYPIPNGTKNLVQVFDPKTNQWSMASPLPISVKYAAGVATTGTYAPKRIYVFGGDANNEAYQNASRYYTYDVGPINATQVYDPLTNSWSFGASMFSARYGLVAANINDTLYTIGGKTLDDLNYPKTTYANNKYTPIGYIPEFPSWVILPIFITATLFSMIIKTRLSHYN